MPKILKKSGYDLGLATTLNQEKVLKFSKKNIFRKKLH